MGIVACLLSFSALVVSIIMLARTENLNNATEKLIERTERMMEEKKEPFNRAVESDEKPERENLDELKKDIEKYGVVGASSIWLERDMLRKENERLKKQLAGGRVCDGYCQECENGIKAMGWNGRADYTCRLDCKCRDFKQKDGAEK